jgi:hypothetical protein
MEKQGVSIMKTQTIIRIDEKIYVQAKEILKCLS